VRKVAHPPGGVWNIPLGVLGTIIPREPGYITKLVDATVLLDSPINGQRNWGIYSPGWEKLDDNDLAEDGFDTFHPVKIEVEA
jgi:hypothetical protein